MLPIRATVDTESVPRTLGMRRKYILKVPLKYKTVYNIHSVIIAQAVNELAGCLIYDRIH